jgi:hypothetical protein
MNSKKILFFVLKEFEPGIMLKPTVPDTKKAETRG